MAIFKNPITDIIRESVKTSKDRLNFAVPFISSFSLTILNSNNTNSIADKRILTRFDESSISSFDLPTLRQLIELGFTIRYDNSIHLKLYIMDYDVYVTSSNLTKGGFEDNIELTTKIDLSNIANCSAIFEELWRTSTDLTKQLIEDNWGKYEILNKRENYNKKPKKQIKIENLTVDDLDIKAIINAVYNLRNDYIENAPTLAFESNKIRENTKDRLKNGFQTDIFYAPEGHKQRRNNLFYEFVYGFESQLAGTGLREVQFQSVFEHNDFRKVVEYLCPEIIGLKPWNFNDKDVLREFCNGIFEFDIPQYKEAIPIRLASYFYPQYFYPIFKLEHLQKICNAFGLSTDAESYGERFFVYNSFLTEEMKTLPYNNYIKSNISYQIMYIVELHTRLSNGEHFDTILNDYNKIWIKGFIKSGLDILKQLNIVK